MNEESLLNQNIRIRATNSIFTNSDILFVEYSDIIRPVQFALISIMSHRYKDFDGIFDMSKISGMTERALMEFYYNRRHANVLFDLLKEESKGTVEADALDEMLDKLINAIGDEGIRLASNLKFAHAIRNVYEDKEIIKKIKVWYPFNNDVIRQDIESTYTGHVEFVHGPIDEVIEKMSGSITYVFSDLTNLLVLEELNKLDLSAILVPADYSYNKTNKKDKVDIEALSQNHVFKFSYFDNYEY